MEVRFRKNDIPGQNKADRKTDTERYDLRTYGGGNGYVLVYGETSPAQHHIERQRVNYPVEHRIGPSTRKVAESLHRNKPDKRFMAKINKSYYNMSGFGEQRF